MTTNGSYGPPADYFEHIRSVPWAWTISWLTKQATTSKQGKKNGLI
jgi:hypothetical protein